MQFSNMEYTDMHFLYGFTGGNARAAREEYRRRYPGRRLPSARTIESVHRRLRECGHFRTVNWENNRPRSATSINVEENILDYFTNHPESSTRRAALRFSVS